jgi:hypothetical protein
MLESQIGLTILPPLPRNWASKILDRIPLPTHTPLVGKLSNAILELKAFFDVWWILFALDKTLESAFRHLPLRTLSS